MAFDKGNEYIRDVLDLFSTHYVKEDWAANGPAILTDVYRRNEHSEAVHALEKEAFYFLNWSDINLFFDKQEDTVVDMEILRRKAFAVHLWNSRSHDLIVDSQSLVAAMFKAYCVYCNPLKVS